MRHPILLVAATLAAVSPALAASPVTIDDLAPPASYLVARASQASELRDELLATPVGGLWEDGRVREWLEGLADRAVEAMALPLDELGLEREDVPWPTGHVGVAAWVPDEAPLSASRFLVAADFGEEAEAFVDLVVELAEEAREREGGFEIAWDDYGPYEIMTTTSFVDEDLLAERRAMLDRLRGEEDWADADLELMEAMLEEEATPARLHLTRAGELVLLSSDLDRVKASLDRVDEREIEAVAGAAFLAEARARHEGAQADVVVRSGELLTRVFEDAGGAGMMFLPEGILEPLGLRDLGAMALGLRLNGPLGQMEVSYSLEVGRRRGLFSLPASAGRFEPPAFVQPGAASATLTALDFSRIIPIAREAIQTLPPEERAQADAALAAFALAAAPIFQSIGPELVAATAYDKPLGPDSSRRLLAVRVVNEPVVIAALNQYGQGLGARVREFLGHQIWETPATLGPRMAVGVGAGWAFLGLPVDVESAFRQLHDDEPQTLAGEARFEAAAELLPPGALGYSWTDTAQWVEFMKWQADHVEEVIRAEFEAGGAFANPDWQPDEEFIAFMVERAREQPVNAILRDAPPADVLTGAMGDQISDARWDDGAIVGRWIMLRPVR